MDYDEFDSYQPQDADYLEKDDSEPVSPPDQPGVTVSLSWQQILFIIAVNAILSLIISLVVVIIAGSRLPSLPGAPVPAGALVAEVIGFDALALRQVRYDDFGSGPLSNEVAARDCRLHEGAHRLRRHAFKPLAFRRLLDVGGGPGTWTAALLRACPGSTAVLFDLPEVIPLATHGSPHSG